MPGLRPLCAMGFVASIGLTCLALACSGQNGNFWPLLVFLIYFLVPIPIIISKHIAKNTMAGIDETSVKRIRDYGLFFTSGLIVSSFALPLIMSRASANSPIIAPKKCFFVELGNLLCYTTMGLFCMYFKPLKT